MWREEGSAGEGRTPGGSPPRCAAPVAASAPADSTARAGVRICNAIGSQMLANGWRVPESLEGDCWGPAAVQRSVS